VIRVGLCCIFRDLPITFGNTTATANSRVNRSAALVKSSGRCMANGEALAAAQPSCAAHPPGQPASIWPRGRTPAGGYGRVLAMAIADQLAKRTFARDFSWIGE
jgi:hypothetical protein